MSLVTRLQLLFAALTLLFLAAGLALVIHHARVAVHAELTASLELTTALVRSAADNPARATADTSADPLIRRLEAVTLQRHIRLEKHRQGVQRTLPTPAGNHTTAPAWFTWLVGFDADQHTHTVRLNDDEGTTLIIRAEPADEIAEAWQGARGLLALLLGFGAATAVLIQWLLRRALQPLQRLLRGLGALERGHYATRLPIPGIPEFDGVARRFNGLSVALDKARAHNRWLHRRLMDVQEDERRHLARELHDELGQCMSALQAEAVAIRDERLSLPTRTRSGAEAIRSTAHRIHDMARQLIHRLHPAELDGPGLVPALRSMTADWRHHHPHLRLHLDIPDTLSLPEPDHGDIHIYRLIQEGLSNVSRHANARRVRVRARIGGKALLVMIADDGDGFDTGTWTPGFGLTSMRERADALGGRMRVFSRPHAGTCLAFRFPLAGTGSAAPMPAAARRRHDTLVPSQNRAVTPAITVRAAPGRSPS